jgi:hypothetical protein
MPAVDRPREVDSEQISDPHWATLDRLERLLRGRGFNGRAEDWHPTAYLNVGRPVEVRCTARADDGSLLRFTSPSRIPMAEADIRTGAMVAVKQTTRQVVSV